jgi:hypothetical protein
LQSKPHGFQQVALLRVLTSGGVLLAHVVDHYSFVNWLRMKARSIGGSASMKTKARHAGLVLAAGVVMLMLTALPVNALAGTAEKMVRGTVIATNLTADPQTIVVKVLLPNKEELIVGARVPTNTRITRGTHAARLADVKAGEPAEVTYLKGSDGLIARAIHVR